MFCFNLKVNIVVLKHLFFYLECQRWLVNTYFQTAQKLKVVNSKSGHQLIPMLSLMKDWLSLEPVLSLSSSSLFHNNTHFSNHTVYEFLEESKFSDYIYISSIKSSDPVEIINFLWVKVAGVYQASKGHP